MSPPRAKSDVRIQESIHVHQQPKNQEQLLPLPSPTSITLDNLEESVNPFNLDRKRKRGEELGQNQKAEARGAVQEWPLRKRQRTSPSNRENKDINPVQRWVEEGSWSGGNIDQNSDIAHSLTPKRSTPSFSKHDSDTSSVSLREAKNPALRSRRYQQILESVGIYMGKPELHLRVAQADQALCKELLEKEQQVPKDSLFNDDLFESTCENIANRNKARVIQDIGRLIVPGPEELFRRGVKQFKHPVETTNESWIKSIPLIKGPRPQPDFAVGLKPSVFTSNQLWKLQPSIGNWQTTSRLAATDEMCFPFLTVEVNCGNGALDIADRQNAHSAAVAANAIIELYRLVSRQNELHRRILTFSISHNRRAVTIYGHYVLIDGKDTSFYRYPIQDLFITNQNGKDKWIAYKFTLNVYNNFREMHYERICSAVDQLPNPEDFDVESFSQQSNPESFEQNDGQLTASYSQQTEPEFP